MAVAVADAAVAADPSETLPFVAAGGIDVAAAVGGGAGDVGAAASFAVAEAVVVGVADTLVVVVVVVAVVAEDHCTSSFNSWKIRTLVRNWDC